MDSKIIIRRGSAITLPGKPLTITPPTWIDGLDEAELGFTTDETRLFVGVDPAADVPQNARLHYPYRNVEIIDTDSRDGFAGMHGNRMRDGGDTDYYSAAVWPTADPGDTTVTYPSGLTVTVPGVDKEGDTPYLEDVTDTWRTVLLGGDPSQDYRIYASGTVAAFIDYALYNDDTEQLVRLGQLQINYYGGTYTTVTTTTETGYGEDGYGETGYGEDGYGEDGYGTTTTTTTTALTGADVSPSVIDDADMVRPDDPGFHDPTIDPSYDAIATLGTIGFRFKLITNDGDTPYLRFQYRNLSGESFGLRFKTSQPVVEDVADALPPPPPPPPVDQTYTGTIAATVPLMFGGAGLSLQPAVGGTGPLRFTLFWQNTNDLDLHVEVSTTDGQVGEIWYPTADRSFAGGTLDVDANGVVANGLTATPVENIFWASTPPSGTYTAYVVYYAQHDTVLDTDWQMLISLPNGAQQTYTGTVTVPTEDAAGSKIFVASIVIP